MGWKKRGAVVEVVWHEEKKVLTLEGEPVLEYEISWPEVCGGGLGGRWISRYYSQLARSWRKRWQRQVYWCACLELAQCRESARPFVPWTGRLSGEVTLLGDGLLSLRMEGMEVRTPGRPCLVYWGDTWKIREGAPCLPGDLPGMGKGWKGRAREKILEQGRARRGAGDWFLDAGWETVVQRKLPVTGLWVTEEGVEIAYPQCVLAPAAEGVPVFRISEAETKESRR